MIRPEMRVQERKHYGVTGRRGRVVAILSEIIATVTWDDGKVSDVYCSSLKQVSALEELAEAAE